MAASLNKLGFAAEQGFHIDQSEQRFRRALEIEERLVSESATVPDYQYVVGRCYLDLGNLLRQAGRIPEAEDALRRAASPLAKARQNGRNYWLAV